jgi:hypothetical protein
LRMQGKRLEADTEESTAAELRKTASQKQEKP